MLILKRTICRRAAPCVGHVNGSCGCTNLAPTLRENTFSWLRLILAEVDGFDDVMLNWDEYTCVFVYITLVPFLELRRHELAMLVVHLDALR